MCPSENSDIASIARPPLGQRKKRGNIGLKDEKLGQGNVRICLRVDPGSIKKIMVPYQGETCGPITLLTGNFEYARRLRGT
jgi:hypothetical protein